MGIKRVGEHVNESMIINEVFLKKNINEINDKSLSRKARYTDYVAEKLVKIYNAPASKNFFLKCAWHLSEDTIWTAVENSRKKKVKSPVKYFVAICNKALQENTTA